MKTILGVDQSSKVLLASEGEDASIMPAEFNGAQIMAYVLTDAQEAAYLALSSSRAGTLFDGAVFTEIPAPVPTAEELAATARRQLDDQERQQAMLDSAVLALVNATPAQLVVYARNNFPSLTLAEQNKMGLILHILAIAVRGMVR